jgi:hypothetical protein
MIFRLRSLLFFFVTNKELCKSIFSIQSGILSKATGAGMGTKEVHGHYSDAVWPAQ